MPSFWRMVENFFFLFDSRVPDTFRFQDLFGHCRALRGVRTRYLAATQLFKG